MSQMCYVKNFNVLMMVYETVASLNKGLLRGGVSLAEKLSNWAISDLQCFVTFCH